METSCVHKMDSPFMLTLWTLRSCCNTESTVCSFHKRREFAGTVLNYVILPVTNYCWQIIASWINREEWGKGFGQIPSSGRGSSQQTEEKRSLLFPMHPHSPYPIITVHMPDMVHMTARLYSDKTAQIQHGKKANTASIQSQRWGEESHCLFTAHFLLRSWRQHTRSSTHRFLAS